MLKLAWISLNKIGGETALEERQWGNLSVSLQDTDTDHNRVVETTVLLPKRPDATMLELEEAARTEAIATLEAVLELLRGSSLAELAAHQEG